MIYNNIRTNLKDIPIETSKQKCALSYVCKTKKTNAWLASSMLFKS